MCGPDTAVNLRTKFEVSNSTHWKDNERGYKISKMGWFEVVYGSLKVIRNVDCAYACQADMPAASAIGVAHTKWICTSAHHFQ